MFLDISSLTFSSHPPDYSSRDEGGVTKGLTLANDQIKGISLPTFQFC